MTDLASKSPDELAQHLLRLVHEANVVTRALRLQGVTVIVGPEFSVSVLGLTYPARPRLVPDEPGGESLRS